MFIFTMRSIYRFCFITILYGLLTAADISNPFSLFENYNSKTTAWIEGGSNSKAALEDAMRSVAELVPWLVSQPEFPPGLDPLVGNTYSMNDVYNHILI
jgi:hypothetical protein